MQLTDSHCHLYSEEFRDDIDYVIKKAGLESVQKFYLPAIDSTTHYAMLLMEIRFPGRCIAMMGLHPCSVRGNYREELLIVEEWLSKRSFAAIGEIGLDFYWDKTYVTEQYDAFRTQVTWALQYDLPIVIHTRNAMEETIEVVREYIPNGIKGIFHCFSGNYEQAKDIIEAGFYLGIGGVLTYKNAGLAEVIKKINLEHIVLETDAPYLSPVPHRGKRNESSNLKFIVEKLALVKNISVEEVAAITTANATKIFRS